MSQNDSLMRRRRSQGGSPTIELAGALRLIPDASRILNRVERADAVPTCRPNRSVTQTPAAQGEALRADSVYVCRVETVLADRFSAIFTKPGDTDKRVRFLRKLVAPSDRPLLREGAVFYWITGTARDVNGNVVSKSYLRFRRTPRVGADEMAELDRLATEIIRAVGGTPVDYEDVD